MKATASTGPKWRAFIDWHAEAVLLDETAQDKHPSLDANGWFAILAAELPDDTYIAPADKLDILYIGDAFNRTLREKLTADTPTMQRIRAARPAGRQLIVILGRPTQRSRKRKSRDYLDGVLRALRVRHRTTVEDGRDQGAFRGEVVSVVNEGTYEPLKPKVLLRPEKPALPVHPEPALPKATAATKIAPPGSSSVVRRKNSGRIRPAANGAKS